MGERSFVKGDHNSAHRSSRPRHSLWSFFGSRDRSKGSTRPRRSFVEPGFSDAGPGKLNHSWATGLDEAVKSKASAAHPLRLRIDVPLLLIVATLLVIGLLFVFSASWEYSFASQENEAAREASLTGREAALSGVSDPSLILQRQIMFVLIGIAGATLLAFFDYHLLQKVAVFAILLTLAALIAVLFVGDERHGAVRTLFNGSIQPSELAKIVLIVYLAVWLYSKREYINKMSFGVLPLSLIVGIMGAFIYFQPDLSALVTVGLMGLLMFFLAGGEMKQIFLFGSLALVVGALIVSASSTWNIRMTFFLSGLKDPAQASYHVQRSIEAFVKGGWFGVGIGRATTKLTGLPVPHTDSIFAVIGEETGVVGAVVVVCLYGLLLWRGLVIARRAPDGLGSLLAAGLSIWLAIEAFVNMAVMVGLMPFAGNALPFISAGGSNMVVSMAAVGFLFNVSRLSEETIQKEERTFRAVVDLRRRDGRRGQSRTRRPSKQNAD